jgi:hypothetical protein
MRGVWVQVCTIYPDEQCRGRGCRGTALRPRRPPGHCVPCTTVAQISKQNPITESAPAQVGTRLSVTLPADHYREMEYLASRKKVSMAWVVRDAVDPYLAAHGDPGSRPGSGPKIPKPATGKGAA